MADREYYFLIFGSFVYWVLMERAVRFFKRKVEIKEEVDEENVIPAFDAEPPRYYELIEKDVEAAVTEAADIRNRSTSLARIGITFIGILIVGLSFIYKEPIGSKYYMMVVWYLSFVAVAAFSVSLLINLFLPFGLRPARGYPIIPDDANLVERASPEYYFKVLKWRNEGYRRLIQRWGRLKSLIEAASTNLIVGVITFCVVCCLVLFSFFKIPEAMMREKDDKPIEPGKVNLTGLPRKGSSEKPSGTDAPTPVSGKNQSQEGPRPGQPAGPEKTSPGQKERPPQKETGPEKPERETREAPVVKSIILEADKGPPKGKPEPEK